ncbi:MAG: ATP-binding cassette domain-containing protein, partial [Bdellovibrionales bacterium]|nr:ATP-binding cassette domain-containing protein [Bdellovibrionales bacterium]
MKSEFTEGYSILIEVKTVSKFFGKTQVLKDLSFRLDSGKGCALLGLSGSGKTTALKLICGLYMPDSGDIVVENILVEKARLREIRKLIGYVIQDGGLFPHMTALSNISIVGEEAGWSREKIDKRVKELAELAKFPMKLLSHCPRQLSGGQRQRVGLMRALLLDPPILLLDEPLGALDPITRSDLQKELKDLFHELRKTFVLVTHDLFEAGFIADHILLLKEGKIVQRGTLLDLIKNPA